MVTRTTNEIPTRLLMEVNHEVAEHLIEEAKNYKKNELNRYIDEISWEDWMEEFVSDEYHITEGEAESIDRILTIAFKSVHGETV